MKDSHLGTRPKMLFKKIASAIERAIVYDDDLHRGIVGSQRRRNGLHDDVLFVERRNQDTHRRSKFRVASGGGTQFFDQRQNSDNERAPADQQDAENKNSRNAEAKNKVERKEKTIGPRRPPLPARYFGHYLRFRLVHQLRNGHELVARVTQAI